MAKKLFKVFYSHSVEGHGYVWAEDRAEAENIMADIDRERFIYQDGFRFGYAVEYLPEEEPKNAPWYEILNPEMED